jgi:hypothetical protein
MPLDASSFIGNLSFFAGFSAASGKTLAVKAALADIRSVGTRAAILCAGYEGERPGPGAGGTNVELWGGEIFSTAADVVDRLDCEPAILAGALGSSALGPIVLARAGRRGRGILVGPSESSALAALADEAMRAQYPYHTILVDGALDRLSPISALPNAQLFCTARIDRANLPQVAQWMADLYRRAHLPLWNEGALMHNAPIVIDGPLSRMVLEKYAVQEHAAFMVKDFAHIFLRPEELTLLAAQNKLFVQKEIDFQGFIVALCDVSQEECEARLPPEVFASILSWNPYEDEKHEHGLP